MGLRTLGTQHHPKHAPCDDAMGLLRTHPGIDTASTILVPNRADYLAGEEVFWRDIKLIWVDKHYPLLSAS